MRFEKNKKYATYALLAVLAVGFAAALISIAMHADSVGAFLAKVAKVFSPIFYAGVLLLVLTPVANFFERQYEKLFKKAKKRDALARSFGMASAYVILLGVLTLAVVIMIPQFATMYEFLMAQDLSTYLSALDGMANDVVAYNGEEDLLSELVLTLTAGMKNIFTEAFKRLPTVLTKVAVVFGDVLSQISGWVLALIISIYAMIRLEKLKAGARKINAALFSPETAKRIGEVCGQLYTNTGYFFSSRAYNSIALAVVYYFVLWLMGLKFHPVICLLMAICSFVPVFGSLIGGAIGTLLVLVTDIPLVGWFVLVYVLITVLDTVLLRPHITNQPVRVSFGTTMICVLIGYFAAGVLGAVFAVPLYATVRNILFARGKTKTKNG